MRELHLLFLIFYALRPSQIALELEFAIFFFIQNNIRMSYNIVSNQLSRAELRLSPIEQS